MEGVTCLQLPTLPHDPLHNMHQFHTYARYIYFSIFPACGSRLIMQFYKINATSAKAARNPIIISCNMQCVLATCTPMSYETLITFLLVQKLTCHESMNLASSIIFHYCDTYICKSLPYVTNKMVFGIG